MSARAQTVVISDLRRSRRRVNGRYYGEFKAVYPALVEMGWQHRRRKLSRSFYVDAAFRRNRAFATEFATER